MVWILWTNVKSVNSEPFLLLPISVFCLMKFKILKILPNVYFWEKLSILVHILNKGNIIQKRLCQGLMHWNQTLEFLWTAWLKVVKG